MYCLDPMQILINLMCSKICACFYAERTTEIKKLKKLTGLTFEYFLLNLTEKHYITEIPHIITNSHIYLKSLSMTSK